MNVNKIKTKVAENWNEHKEAYIGIAAGVLVGAAASAGATAFVMHRNSSQTASVVQGIAYKSPVTTHVIQQSIARAGHAGKVFVDRNDPTIKPFMSMRELSKRLGVSRAAIYDYLAGRIPDLAGGQYDMIMDGAPPLMAEMKVKA